MKTRILSLVVLGCCLFGIALAMSLLQLPAVAAPQLAAESSVQNRAMPGRLATATPLPCRPGEGWRWTAGDFVPEVAAQAQRALQAEGVASSVIARSFGEIDSCGSYYQSAVDFTVKLRDQQSLAAGTDQERTTQSVRQILATVARPSLGILRVDFPTGEQIILRPDAAMPSLPTTTARPSHAAVLTKKVYVVVYDPLLSNGKLLSQELNWNSHATLTQGTVGFFAQASHGEVNYQVVQTSVLTDGWPVKKDGFRYTEAEYLAVYHGQTAAHSPDEVNYNAIVNDSRLDICGKANRGEIDEVWIYNGPWFGFYESTLVGPGAYWYNSSPVPAPYSCNRLIPIMGPSPHVGLDNAVHNFGHRAESAMQRVYGGVWDSVYPVHNNFEKYTLLDFMAAADYGYNGCGNIHAPPNGTSGYDYSNSGSALTTCSDFVNYPGLHDPLSVAQWVTCTTWGCDHLQYLSYWFQHLPHNSGCGSDGVAADWWPYFAEPGLANTPSISCSGAATTPTPTGTRTMTATPTPSRTSAMTPASGGTPDPFQGTWRKQTSGTSNWLWPVQFVNQNWGQAAGAGGTVLKSENAGLSWGPVATTTPPARDIHDMQFVDTSYGWVVGYGFVARTTDGGAHWTTQNYGATHDVMGTFFRDRNQGWLVGAQWIRRTTDGGTTWQGVQMPAPTTFLQDVFFADATTGWVVGWDGNILKSTDGGASWSRQTSGVSQILEGVHFWNSSNRQIG